MSLSKYIQDIFSFIGKFGVGTDNPQSAFDVQSTERGSTPFPRMTAAQKNAIASPVEGETIYQTDGLIGVHVFKSGSWEKESGKFIEIDGYKFTYIPIVGNDGSSLQVGDLAMNGRLPNGNLGRLLKWNGTTWDVLDEQNI